MLFLAITLLVPFILFGLTEGVFRLVRPDGGLPLFVHAQLVNGDYLVASPRVGARWFGGIDHPPTPAAEMFAATKPNNAFRVFVLGESATAGFPYPRNATFSRFLRDALRDVLPGDSVEVVNLGIAATNSFAILDMATEVARQHPDAVLIYAGHNEYYGALGAASRVNIPGGTAAARLYLRLLRLRTVLWLRDMLASLRSRAVRRTDDLAEASLMEVLARDKQIPLQSSLYDKGAKQFADNLKDVVEVFRNRGIPVLIGSLASNLSDQAPFDARANHLADGADAAFAAARSAVGVGDTLSARRLFVRARDLDVVRFRAPSEFNRIIASVAAETGAVYVPVAEGFAAASPGGIPGSGLFLEHVHPNRGGYALIGRVFFEAVLKSGILGSRVDTTRLRSWDEYLRGTKITPFDERIAYHTVRTLTLRWPFVPVARQVDYWGSYRPVTLLDSLAFDVSRGKRWELAKMELATAYERRSQYDSAATEYAGLARDAPLVAEPLELMARELALAGRPREADAALWRAVEINPTPAGFAALGLRAAQRHELAGAVSFYNRSLQMEPNQPKVLYQLSLVYAMSRDLPNARNVAVRLSRIAPGYPSLPELLQNLGMRR